MRPYERTPIDRSTWTYGPWEHELENHIEFQFRNLECCMMRNDHGAWCGYVAVPLDHPHAKGLLSKSDLEVHGGITYHESTETHCWFGFDCAHAGDTLPGYRRDYAPGVYRDKSYAKVEVMRLAEQLASASVDLSPTPFTLSPEGYQLIQVAIKNPYDSDLETFLTKLLSHITAG